MMQVMFGNKPVPQVQAGAVVPFEPKLKDWARAVTPRFIKPMGSKNELFEAFVKSDTQFAAVHEKMATFVASIFDANFSVVTHSKETRDLFNNNRTRITRNFAQQIAYQPSPINLLALYEQDGQVVYEAMQEAKVTQLANLVTNLFAILRGMLVGEQVGQIEFTSPKTCRFSSYRWKFSERVLKEYDVVEGGYWVHKRDVQQDLWQELYYHELIDVSRNPFTADTPVPERVIPLRTSVPDILRPLVEIVDGKEVTRHFGQRLVGSQTTQEVVSRKLVYNPDPAIVIGDIVVTSWVTGQEMVYGPRGTFLDLIFGKKR